jgi:hypothetical protein
MNKRERNRKKAEEQHKKKWINKQPIERVDKEESDLQSLLGQIT